MRRSTRASLLVPLLLPVVSLAAGRHEALGCNGCHVAARPNTTYLNPATKAPYAGAAALCFACHQDAANGGRGVAPISQHVSHPFDVPVVNPRRARVPPDLLLADGRFGCMSCHDPHPSNRNYKYLRSDVGPKGEQVDRLCALCHPAKAEPAAEAGHAPASGRR